MHVAKTIVCWAALCGDALSWARPLTFPSSPRQLEARELALVLGRQSNSNSSLPALTASITAIQNSVTDTNSSVVPFQGGSIKGLIGLIKINEGVVSLGDNIDNAIKTAQQSPQLNNQDSTTLGVQFLGLQPKITDLLDRLQTKRPEFDKAGFKILDVRSLIRDDLAGQQKQADLLGSSLVKILDPALQPLATPVNQQIQGNFSKAVTAFSGRGGKIKIPAKAVPALSNLLADIGKALGIKASSSNAVAPESNAQAEAPNPAAIVPATDTELSASDPAVAEQSAEQVLAATSDDSLNNLGDDENDLRGIPPLVLSVLRKYGII